MSDILRVYLCGGHSTGKTTLLKDLLPLLKLHAVTNVAREVLQESDLDRDKIDYQKYPDKFELLQELVLKRLLETDKDCVSNRKDFISDRGIDPLIYADLYLGEEARKRLQQLPFVQEYIERLRNSLLFVLKPHPECLVDDGIRMRPEIEELKLFTSKMHSLLEELNIPYRVVELLDRCARQQQVLEEIRKIKPELIMQT